MNSPVMRSMTDLILLRPCAYRVPCPGDVFLGRDGVLLVCKTRNYSKRAKPKYIVFSPKLKTQAGIVHSLNDPETNQTIYCSQINQETQNG